MTEAENHALHRDIHRLVDTLPILCYNAEKAIGGTEDEAAYMIIGAGGVGGPVGAYLSKSGADTTLIARGSILRSCRSTA